MGYHVIKILRNVLEFLPIHAEVLIDNMSAFTAVASAARVKETM